MPLDTIMLFESIGWLLELYVLATSKVISLIRMGTDT